MGSAGPGARIRNWPILNAGTITPASPPVGEYLVRYNNGLSSAASDFLDSEGYVYISGINMTTSFRFRPETYTALASFSFEIEYLVERD